MRHIGETIGGTHMKDYRMDLTLFDDGGAGAAAATSGAATTGDAVSTGTEGNQPARDFDAEFDAMVKGDFKDAYNKKVQGIVKDRLKGSNRQNPN